MTAFFHEKKSPLRIACVGDSITEGHGSSNPVVCSYPARLQSLLGDSVLVRNFGVGARTGMKLGFEGDGTRRGYVLESAYRESLDFAPDIVLIMFGTNDTKEINAPLLPVHFEPDMMELVRSYQQLPSHPVVFLAAPPMVEHSNWTINEPSLVGEIIPRVKNAAAATDAVFVDVHAATLSHPEFYTPDGVHLNDFGYINLASFFASALSPFLKTGGDSPSFPPSSNPPSRKKLPWGVIGSFLVLLSVAALLFCMNRYSPETSCIAVVPDSLENVLCPWSLLQDGRYSIWLNNAWYPSRYLPWYSLIFILPFQYLTHSLFGASWGILFASYLLVSLLFFVGFCLGCRRFTGLLSVLLFLSCPYLLRLHGIAMTEYPYLAFLLLMLCTLMRMSSSPRISSRQVIVCGIFGALAGLMRSSGYVMFLVPSVLILVREKTWSRRILLLALLGFWGVLAVCATGTYNFLTFGTPFRSGYHFWCPVPYEFPGLTFNLACIPSNLSQMLSQSWLWYLVAELILCALWIFLVHGKKLPFRPALFCAVIFSLFHAVLILSLYLGYFFYEGRLYVTAVAVALPASCAVLDDILHFALRKRFSSPLWLGGGRVLEILLLLALLFRFASCGSPSFKKHDAEHRWMQEISRVLPENAILLSPFSPGLADYYLTKDYPDRRLIPFSRQMEYAGKIVAERPFDVSQITPAPVNAVNHLCPGLLQSDACRLVYPDVLSDSPQTLDKILADGRPVFFLSVYPPGMTEEPAFLKNSKSVKSLTAFNLAAGIWQIR